MSFEGVCTRWLTATLFALCAMFFTTALPVAQADEPARTAEQVLYTIAIGQNDVPASLLEKEGELRSLHYADDDAAQMYQLLAGVSRQAFLLTVLDPETQARFPEAARAAVAPTMAALERVVETARGAIERDRAAGREPVVVFFVSGHGVHADDGGAALALFDGPLTQKDLYEKVLARLPAHYVHLIIDACHAGAVVGSRDVSATLEPLQQTDIATYLQHSSLAAFPHVGVILASTASTQSFEWDAYRGGIFAHELLSALRGAADVNHDARIEYSELAAFFSAANLQVDDPRARLRVVVQPPRTNARAAVLEHARAVNEFRLLGRSEDTSGRPFYIETEAGSRLLDMHPERGSAWQLWLPAGVRLYVVSGDREFELNALAGASVQLGGLNPRQPRPRPRGALESSLRRGLFGTPFGPAFYRGFTSDRLEFVSVQLSPDTTESDESGRPLATSAHDTPQRHGSTLRTSVGYGLLLSGGVGIVAASVFTGAALSAHAEYENAEYERPAAEAQARFERYRTAAWVSAGTAAALAGTGLVLLLWPDSTSASTPRSGKTALGITPTGCFLRGSF